MNTEKSFREYFLLTGFLYSYFISSIKGLALLTGILPLFSFPPPRHQHIINLLPHIIYLCPRRQPGGERKKNLDEGAFHYCVLAHTGLAEHDAHHTGQIVSGGAFAQEAGVLMHFFHVGHVSEEVALVIIQTFNARSCFGTDGDLGKLIAVKVLNGGSTRGDYHVRTAEYFYLYFRFVVHSYIFSLHFYLFFLACFIYFQ